MQTEIHSTYLGWTVWNPPVRGEHLWVASRPGELKLRADTLAGLRRSIRRAESVIRVVRPADHRANQLRISEGVAALAALKEQRAGKLAALYSDCGGCRYFPTHVTRQRAVANRPEGEWRQACAIHVPVNNQFHQTATIPAC